MSSRKVGTCGALISVLLGLVISIQIMLTPNSSLLTPNFSDAATVGTAKGEDVAVLIVDWNRKPPAKPIQHLHS